MQISSLQSRDLLWYWLPPLAWCGALLLMSGDLGSANNTGSILEWLLSWFPPLSPAQFKLMHFYVRKTIGHFGNYACLYFLWFRACRGQLRWTSGRAFSLAIGLCLVMAILDEGHQYMFACPHQQPEGRGPGSERGRHRGPGYLDYPAVPAQAAGRKITF